MAITLNIVSNSAAYTNMRIFRALTAANVYSGAPIADVVIAASYVDASAVDGQIYYYGVELYNATDKTQFSVIKVISLADYGPLNGIVQSNITNFGTALLAGDADRGIFIRATSAQLATIPGVLNTKTKLEDITLQATGTLRPQSNTDAGMFVAMLDGKIIVIPPSPNVLYGAVSASGATSDTQKIHDYLANNLDKALIDINGYRWKIKLMTKELLQRHPEIIIPPGDNVGILRKIPRLLTTTAVTGYEFVFSDTDNAPTSVYYSAAAGIVFLPGVGNTATAKSATVYFEYAGVAPPA